VKKKLTPQNLARIDAWYSYWNKPRKTIAAELGICVATLMNAAKRRNAYEHRG
jgi:hypothetical protein